MSETFYHVTRSRFLESIFNEGLKPQGYLGKGYSTGGFKRARSSVQKGGVYLFKGIAGEDPTSGARLGVSTQFFGGQTDPDEWHILEVEVPESCILKRDPEFRWADQSRIEAWIALCTIPPEYITYLNPVVNEE